MLSVQASGTRYALLTNLTAGNHLFKLCYTDGAGNIHINGETLYPYMRYEYGSDDRYIE